MDSQRKCFWCFFLRLESAPGEDALKTVEGFRMLHSLVDVQWQGLRRMTPILKEVLLWIKWYQIASNATEKVFARGKVN